MARFAIAAEGPTDHPVLARLIATRLGNQHAITEVFPNPDATTLDGRPPGGWSVLFDHLRHGGVEEALQFNDFLVLHVDTDVRDDFLKAPIQAHDEEEQVDAIVRTVREHLLGLIEPDVLADFRDQILFAVAVDSIECWLLPLFAPKNHADKRKTTGCLPRVNHYLKKKNQPPLSDANGEQKHPKRYEEVARGYRKPKDLNLLGPRNPSLKIFLDALDSINPEQL